MDPLSALSLVANIFEVVGFTAEVIRIATEIYEQGSTARFQDVDDAAAKWRESAEHLRSWYDTPEKRERAKLQIDRQLLGLTQEVVRIARDLKDLLDRIQRSSRANSFAGMALTTFRTIWRKGSVEELEQRLKSARESLQFHLIVLIKTRIEEESDQAKQRDVILQSLDENTKAGLSDAVGLLHGLQGNNTVVKAGQEQSEKLAMERHEELVQMIHSLSLPKLIEDPLSHKHVVSMLDYVGHTRRDRVNAAVVSSLWFPTMQDREDGISEAHKQTYEWIYREPTDTHGTWDDFGEFLRSDSSIYWITGKPGSGKSTLMKFLNRNDTTANALRSWSGAQNLFTARFYFYYNGTQMQKSQIGVFRSLLHQLLEPRPQLAEECMGDRYFAMCFAPEEPTTFVPSLWELKRALEKLVRVQREERFFFSVDGLDEYDADDTEMALLAKTFAELSTLPNVKGLLSSRPLETFEQSFRGFPRLRLHDLTRPDITTFIESKIRQHPGLKRIMTDDAASQAFVDEIVESSSGVFLWVHLVVRSLLEGLQNYDDLADLYTRLRELPRDLEDLYRHMWVRIPLRYRSQAARLLQIVEAATADGGRLSVMGLSFAYEKNEEVILNAPVAPLSGDETASRHEVARVHIASRCMGLVEINNLRFAPSPFNSGGMFKTDLYDNAVEYAKKHPHVVFIHRTISEFITTTEIRQQLRDSTPGFHAAVSLFLSAVHRIKTFAYSGSVPYGLPKSLEALVYNALGAAGRAEVATGEAQTRLVMELDEVMTQHARTYMPSLTDHWSEYLIEQGELGSGEKPARIRRSCLLSLAIRHGLSLFVQEQIRACPSVISQQTRPLLDFALRPYCRVGELRALSLHRVPAIVNVLLEHGANPNEKLGYMSVWHWFADNIDVDAKLDSDFFLTTPPILTSLLEHGADPFITVGDRDDSALEVFETMHTNRDYFGVTCNNWLGFQAEMRDVVALMKTLRKEARTTAEPPKEIAPSTPSQTPCHAETETETEKARPRRFRRFVQLIFCCSS